MQPVKYRGVTAGPSDRDRRWSARNTTPAGRPTWTCATYRQVFVRYEIDRAKLGHVPDTETAVKLGLRARLAAQGITGLTYIELDFVDPDALPGAARALAAEGGRTSPRCQAPWPQVQDAAQQVLQKLNTVDLAALTASVTGVLQDLHEELTSGDVHAALASDRAIARRT